MLIFAPDDNVYIVFGCNVTITPIVVNLSICYCQSQEAFALISLPLIFCIHCDNTVDVFFSVVTPNECLSQCQCLVTQL